ncbi:Rab family GTPase [Entamoeba histolytica HM-1:IMSS-B]|uniref:Rab family GTPase n=6 Tax=Entamoeba histolytica TaxID=5759 RepID=A0A8U0WPN9_ENTH1|nr:Rab family GTPase [Entamoeba histolytica HM-1:IMSS]EMD45563.1 Rab family gtpase [Entamoeba histolytica KU27]EMH77041.1 Rab family GTPase [Entamoeba histolytica HM-1:IMSS-B]EMS16472.1 Rab family GTPase [Entamoeba histolytica HM-3:IMSS]ENY61117.1 Rab family GTPase, putative [Entamoeba histolytica HM-1:IMSS-A]BAD34977.1 EhRabC2 protein [Entamoeba histolytica]|eukprot:XP_653593.1 Rab family GTPase [Entamoeba histolytica HM-1:IMSS]
MNIEPHLQQQVDMTFKILIIGESAVGKTAILERYCENEFHDELISTIGVDFKSRIINYQGKTVKLQLWDTAGQERFRNITSSYYRGTHGCLIVYDVTDITSFEKITYWINELNDCSIKPEILVVGNKIDSEDAVVTSEIAEKFCRLSGGLRSMRCSAKTGENVESIFNVLVDSISKNKNIMERLISVPKLLDDASLQPTQKKQSCC